MTTINNLFDCFNFKLLRITFTAYGHLRVILDDSEVSVKPMAIQYKKMNTIPSVLRTQATPVTQLSCSR
ncbi:hypothetical protein BFX86_09445 [Enterobacter hormaechei]|nr:hypothetical protein SS57_22425 [Enterobacter hormaechei subsp. xiangfangensis]KJM98840.1 hypothetical protein SS42_22265 [Enterobacter hormaechei subsp. xiangfangensis]PLV50107.1 hypothetical protein BFX86_09445 [Enterobacter hormaechei]